MTLLSNIPDDIEVTKRPDMLHEVTCTLVVWHESDPRSLCRHAFNIPGDGREYRIYEAEEIEITKSYESGPMAGKPMYARYRVKGVQVWP